MSDNTDLTNTYNIAANRRHNEDIVDATKRVRLFVGGDAVAMSSLIQANNQIEGTADIDDLLKKAADIYELQTGKKPPKIPERQGGGAADPLAAHAKPARKGK